MNYGLNMYNPYIYPNNPINPSMAQSQPQSNNNNGIIWVQGLEGAKSYMVTPGTSILLMDSESQRFYIKSADPSGMPAPIRAFDYVEIVGQAPSPVNDEYVTREEFNALAQKLDALSARKTTKKVSADE